MSHTTEIGVKVPFDITPAELADVGMPLPLDVRGNVPIKVRGLELTPSDTTFTTLGGGAIALSIGKPFGFMTIDSSEGRVIQSPKTEGITLAPDLEQPGQWRATFETPGEPTQQDLGLLAYGVFTYAEYAQKRRDRMHSKK